MNKYSRTIKGVSVDVYDVLKAFEVTDPALQHLIKKALATGKRGHKSFEQDLNEILESAKRAVELNKTQSGVDLNYICSDTLFGYDDAGKLRISLGKLSNDKLKNDIEEICKQNASKNDDALRELIKAEIKNQLQHGGLIGEQIWRSHKIFAATK